MGDPRAVSERARQPPVHGGVFRVRFSPDGTLLGSAGADGAVRLWDVWTGADAGAFTREGNLVRGLAFWPDGSLIASGWSDGAVRLFATDNRRLRALERDLAITDERPRTFASHSGWVTDVAVSRDGALLASVAEDGLVVLRHMPSDSVRSIVSRGHRPKRLALSPDGALLATAGQDGTVRLWSTADHKQVRSLTGHPAQVLGVAFHPYGTLLASAGADGTIRVWE